MRQSESDNNNLENLLWYLFTNPPGHTNLIVCKNVDVLNAGKIASPNIAPSFINAQNVDRENVGLSNVIIVCSSGSILELQLSLIILLEVLRMFLKYLGIVGMGLQFVLLLGTFKRKFHKFLTTFWGLINNLMWICKEKEGMDKWKNNKKLIIKNLHLIQLSKPILLVLDVTKTK